MKPGDTLFTTPRIEALDHAWARYQSVRRSVCVGAPHAMRRFFRSQDEATLTVELTRYSSAASSGVRGWIAACRKQLGRHVRVEPLGIAVLGMPSAFLVRVPRWKSALLDERLWGRIGPHEPSRERMRLGYIGRLQEKRQARRDAKIARLKAKMIAALTEARQCLLDKGATREEVRALTARGVVLTDTMRDRVEELRRKSYSRHARYARCWQRANNYRRLLAAEGFMYDLNSIDTAVSLGEGDRGQSSPKVQTDA